MKQTKTYNNFPVYVTRRFSRPLRCSLGLSFVLYSLLFSTALLTGCSDDTEWSGAVVDNIEVQLCTTGYEEEGDMSRMGDVGSLDVTRAWTPPDGFVPFSQIWGTNGPFVNQKDLVHKSISVFFTKNGEAHETTLFFKNTTDEWQMRSEDELKEGSYYVYGFIPKEDATSVTIRPNGNYVNGAELTLSGLNTMTASDVCVIVGAKDGNGDNNTYNENNPYTVTGIRAGDFNVTFNGGKDLSNNSDPKNYLFLLFDHIYSALRFKFTINGEYAKLRSIKLRKLELVAYADDKESPVKAKYNATVTLKKTDNGSSPIVGEVDFTEDPLSADMAFIPIFNPDDLSENYVDLSTTQNFMGCFVPGDHTYFKLRTTYDVYDRQGNLIRQRCQAENSFDLRSKFDSYMKTVRGHSYDYTIEVKPTYLYVLSEPDLDNPTVKIN